MIFAFLSGAVIDKMTQAEYCYVDFIAWSIPCLIWAFSQDFGFLSWLLCLTVR